MTESEQFNKLCAEFLGWTYATPYYYPLIKTSGIADLPWDINVMKFHSDWNWIMPVWNKIMAWGKAEYGIHWNQCIGEMFITITNIPDADKRKERSPGKFYFTWLNTGSIEDIIYPISEFINWYNLNGKMK